MAKDTLFENGILDNDEGLLVDDEGNVIEDTSEEKEKDKKTDISSDLDPNEILVDDFGNVITLDEDGNEIPNPDLDDEDQEAVRQHAIAALNLTQQAKKVLNSVGEVGLSGSTALIDGVRKFAMDVRDLEIDLIDKINPFGEAYAILAKSMNEDSLKQVATVIAGKKINLSIEDARDLAKRALKFKQERGRLPSLTAADPWEKKMAAGMIAFAKLRAEAGNG